ncbi:hypothetical protein [Modestobacter sp. SYSU DS0511]
MITDVSDWLGNWLRAMSRRRRRWVVAGILLATYGAVYLALVGAFTLVNGGQVDWGGPLGGTVGGAAGASVVLWWQSRRMGGLDRLGQLQRAAKQGRLPDDADPAVWRPLLTRELRSMRRARRWVLASFLALSLVLLAVLLVDGAVRTSYLAAGVLVIGAVVLLLGWLSRREQRKLERLLDQLPEPVAS